MHCWPREDHHAAHGCCRDRRDARGLYGLGGAFFALNGGFDLRAAYALAASVVAVAGPGEYSIARVIVGALAVVLAGVVALPRRNTLAARVDGSVGKSALH